MTAAVDNLVLLATTGSTQALARELITAMEGEEQRLATTVIISDRQERGEGRGGRGWVSPAGGLYLSWLRSGLDTETIALLPMLAAAAAQAAVAELGIAGAAVKWPNDILVGGRKLAGILVFARHGGTGWAAVGLGVNIAVVPHLDGTPGLPATAVADHLELGDPELTRDRIACAFVNRLSAAVVEPERALAAWRELLLQRPGDRITVRLASGDEVSGVVAGIEDRGYLRLRCGDAERVITGGDIIES
ncbi:MAG: biotin--[acetyl-CoA-carboxylase] ligase [Thermoanaerobaculales bacterium]|jgi:BirA family biotin operon repressor/biotin-[acetyl-CoA-carboxylase] ligase|nr:biotin--[acetyl-CoA-carboxylase] ligase [Thermoanaerobaculales bacterium]